VKYASRVNGIYFTSRRAQHDTSRRSYFTFCASKILHDKEKTMSSSRLRDMSLEFSVMAIRMCGQIKGHYSLTNQLERAATSIGANIHEANYAHGRADFIAKLQIALKECYETKYWLTLFVRSGLADRTTVKPLYDQCGTLRCLLVASINTAKKNLEKKNAL
jgi:four helix bundle protein